MDIINSLPDPILCHILSFLPTKISVRTSVLASRWRYLWTYVSSLRFDEELCGSEPAGNMIGFSDMVYRVLLQHNGPIDSFSIRPYDDSVISKYQIDAWISTAVARKVQVLYLSNLFEVRLPQCCFNCKTLVELTIRSCTISVEPGAVCLPKLKRLNLLSNYYDNEDALPNLLSGCLAIESLVIERECLAVENLRDMDRCDMLCCNVCSPTLKSLVLTCSVACYETDHEHKLVLDIPAVQYLRIDDNNSSVIRAENLSSLVVADIRLSSDFLPQEVISISHCRDTFQFLEKLSNARSLTFRSNALMMLLRPTLPTATTRFHNLTKLRLEADWYTLTELLKGAYNLEWLVIEKVQEELQFWREPKHVPECLLSSLQCVYIFGFAGEAPELDMLSYILGHAKVLKAIKIFSRSRDKGCKLEMLRHISFFPRASHKCLLTFE